MPQSEREAPSGTFSLTPVNTPCIHKTGTRCKVQAHRDNSFIAHQELTCDYSSAVDYSGLLELQQRIAELEKALAL